MNNNTEILVKKAEEFNIILTDTQIKQFEEYWSFLYAYNEHTNIVSSAEPDLVTLKHFADSLSIGILEKYINFKAAQTVLDIGTGGGFPGVPMIIAFPLLKLCAVDSVAKKTEFLHKLSLEIGIENRIKILNTRAEELSSILKPEEKFDISVSRAVSRLNVLLEYMLPFVKVGGCFVAYKAKTACEEVAEAKNALSVLGGEVIEIINYKLSDEERNLILVKKIKPTPEKYPRRTGIPHKTPL